MSEAREQTLPTKAVRRPTKAARRPGALSLRVTRGDGRQVERRFEAKVVRGGRSRAADLSVEDPSMSGLHFELRAGEAGVELVDLDSRNGLWIDGRRVFHLLLQPGDRFVAGDCSVELLAVGEVEVQVTEADQLGDMVGRSPVMRELFADLERLAPTPIDVLILGETGTGKELAARAIHRYSKVSDGPFRVLDCGSLPPSLAEAAIFGHRKGAFTGADRHQPGVFEEADGGTLFLDEIGELSPELQVKLLRALDRREVSRVGEPVKVRKVEVRVLAATHRDLRRMVAEDRFREDLYFRLARAVVDMPPLRERGGDVELLARAFLARLAEEHGLEVELSPEAVELLNHHPWPGNVRELKNVIEHAAFLAQRGRITPGDIALRSTATQAARLDEFVRTDHYWKAHEELDRILLPRALAAAGGNLSEAARRLEVSRPTLRKRLKELGLYSPG